MGWRGRRGREKVEGEGKVAHRPILRLRDPEKDNDGLDPAPDGEDNVRSPSNLIH